MREDFSDVTKRAVAARVGFLCSNPDCRAPTSGPRDDPKKAINLGVAAHIRAASPGGPRFDAAMTSEERVEPANAIWLCQTCAKRVDNDPSRFTVQVLGGWKRQAELDAHSRVGKTAVAAATIRDKWVNADYVDKAGIRARLEAEGFHLGWWGAHEESERVDIDGWEHVIVEEKDGSRAYLKIGNNPSVGGYLVYLKKRKGQR